MLLPQGTASCRILPPVYRELPLPGSFSPLTVTTWDVLIYMAHDSGDIRCHHIHAVPPCTSQIPNVRMTKNSENTFPPTYPLHPEWGIAYSLSWLSLSHPWSQTFSCLEQITSIANYPLHLGCEVWGAILTGNIHHSYQPFKQVSLSYPLNPSS